MGPPVIVNRAVDNARKRLCHLARELGYLVGRDEEDGVVTVTLLSLDCRRPSVRVVQIVPDTYEQDHWPLGERLVSAGLAVPHRVTPREVQRVMDLLMDIERSIA